MIITPLSYEYLKAYSFYEKGSYPNGQAWNQESHKYIQAMMVLSNQYRNISKEDN